MALSCRCQQAVKATSRRGWALWASSTCCVWPAEMWGARWAGGRHGRLGLLFPNRHQPASVVDGDQGRCARCAVVCRRQRLQQAVCTLSQRMSFSVLLSMLFVITGTVTPPPRRRCRCCRPCGCAASDIFRCSTSLLPTLAPTSCATRKACRAGVQARLLSGRQGGSGGRAAAGSGGRGSTLACHTLHKSWLAAVPSLPGRAFWQSCWPSAWPRPAVGQPLHRAEPAFWSPRRLDWGGQKAWQRQINAAGRDARNWPAAALCAVPLAAAASREVQLSRLCRDLAGSAVIWRS